jgi:hypothetical protein
MESERKTMITDEEIQKLIQEDWRVHIAHFEDVVERLRFAEEKNDKLERLIKIQTKERRILASKFGARDRRIADHFEERKALKEQIELLKKKIEVLLLLCTKEPDEGLEALEKLK